MIKFLESKWNDPEGLAFRRNKFRFSLLGVTVVGEVKVGSEPYGIRGV